jgi:flagellar basal-body rod protein FlgB
MDFDSLVAGQVGGKGVNGLSTTNAHHIDVRARKGAVEQEDAVGEGGNPNGNVVSIEQEMIKLSDTQIQYQTATNLYQKAVNMFRTALGGRSN